MPYKNPEQKAAYAARYRETNRKKANTYAKQYRIENKEIVVSKVKAWRQHNPNWERVSGYNIKRNASRKKRYNTNILYRLKAIYRANLTRYVYLKNGKHTDELLGCSIEELKNYLTSKFQKGMTWGNYGKGWHIDHIEPLCRAKTYKEFETLSHFTNLQPLWAEDNLSKGNKF
jgi:hypothetical protein